LRGLLAYNIIGRAGKTQPKAATNPAEKAEPAQTDRHHRDKERQMAQRHKYTGTIGKTPVHEQNTVHDLALFGEDFLGSDWVTHTEETAQGPEIVVEYCDETWHEEVARISFGYELKVLYVTDAGGNLESFAAVDFEEAYQVIGDMLEI